MEEKAAVVVEGDRSETALEWKNCIQGVWCLEGEGSSKKISTLWGEGGGVKSPLDAEKGCISSLEGAGCPRQDSQTSV